MPKTSRSSKTYTTGITVNNFNVINWDALTTKEQGDFADKFFLNAEKSVIEYCSRKIKEFTTPVKDIAYLTVQWKQGCEEADVGLGVLSSLVGIYEAFRNAQDLMDESAKQTVLQIYSFIKDCPSDKIPIYFVASSKELPPCALPFSPVPNPIINCPLSGGLTSIPRDLVKEVETRERWRKSKKAAPKELHLEDEIYDWLRAVGVDAERKVKTSNGQEIDIWIPGVAMIELKRNGKSVSANDVCQCIDYASEYDLPILLVGQKITTSASRGLSGFSKFASNKIKYIPTDALKPYLRGILK